MKFLAGLLFGAVGIWLYRSEQARQRAQEILPENVRGVVARVTGGSAGEAASTPGYIGTPGVESASGRDRTAPGGDLPPDLGRP